MIKDQYRGLLKEELSEIIKDEGYCFKRDDFDKLRGPGVYIILKDGIAMYVGVSRTCVSRPSGYHKQLRDMEYDEIQLYPVATYGLACRLERLLIEALEPTMNKNRPAEIGRKLMGMTKTQYHLSKRKTERVRQDAQERQGG